MRLVLPVFLFLIAETLVFCQEQPADTCLFETTWKYSSWIDSLDENVLIAETGPVQACDDKDCFISIKNQCPVDEFHFVIVDRKGYVLYETSTMGQGWEPTEIKPDVYFWQAEGIFTSGKPFRVRGHFYIFDEL